MFGVPVQVAANVYCDNQSVVDATSVPTGRLNKKHLAICWHKVRESCAQSICRIAKIDGTLNVADLLTKVLDTARRGTLSQQVLRYFKVR
mmetsp:Transcript_41575/g.58519  ORF Transcript_41575/g.58519 Transcript_41575/m.58519 type:complete len:90 (+) Transcript_41575:3545-3814(+)